MYLNQNSINGNDFLTNASIFASFSTTAPPATTFSPPSSSSYSPDQTTNPAPPPPSCMSTAHSSHHFNLAPFATYPSYSFAYFNPTFAISTTNTPPNEMPASQLITSSKSFKSTLSDANKLSQLYFSPAVKSQQTASRYFDSTSSLGFMPNLGHDSVYLANEATSKSTSYLSTSFVTDGLPKPSASTFTPMSLNINKKLKKRYKKPIEFRKVLPKNSLMMLHELRPNVEYRYVSQSGPIHRPEFTMCVDINEFKFEGAGKTKKLARMQAAEKAVEFLLKHPEYIVKSNNNNKVNGAKTNNESEENVDDEEESRCVEQTKKQCLNQERLHETT
jgi:hypothetical protein